MIDRLVDGILVLSGAKDTQRLLTTQCKNPFSNVPSATLTTTTIADVESLGSSEERLILSEDFYSCHDTSMPTFPDILISCLSVIPRFLRRKMLIVGFVTLNSPNLINLSF